MSPSKQEVDGEDQAFLTTVPLHDDAVWSRERGSRKTIGYLRLAVEIVMAVIIGVLLVTLVNERIGVERPPVPRCMSPAVVR